MHPWIRWWIYAEWFRENIFEKYLLEIDPRKGEGMQKIIWGFIVVLLSLGSSLAMGRVWLDSTGKHKTEAEFVSVSEDGQTVTLKKPDGKETGIPYKNLSTRDQTYIQTTLKSQKSEVSENGEETLEFPLREWTDNSGRRSLTASFVSVSDGWETVITFKKKNGKNGKLPFDELSRLDQEYIQNISLSLQLDQNVIETCRDWESNVGQHSMAASFISLSEDGNMVTLVKECGKEVKIAFSEFSSDDQKYIQDVAQKYAKKTGQAANEQEMVEQKKKAACEPLYGGKFLAIPFNPYVKELPKDFRGHDIIQLWKAIEIEAKETFESTSDYQKRLDDLVKKPLYGRVFLDSYFAIKSISLEKYDADREMFQIPLPRVYNTVATDAYRIPDVTQASTINRNYLYTTMMDVDSADLGTYTGSNVYGVEKEIKEDALVCYELAFYNSTINPANIRSSNHANDIILNIPKEKAKQVHMNFLYVFKLAPFLGSGKPYTYEDYDYKKPTIDSPTERHYLTQGIYIKKLIWVLYDEETGEIYTTIPVRGIQEVKVDR